MPTLSRRSPAAIALLLMLALFVTGTAYAAMAPKDAKAGVEQADSVDNGKKLFTANCANCHGANGLGVKDSGPSLAGVGAASVDFQMGTGRMPMAAPGVQAPGNIRTKFSDKEIADVGAYVATLGAGPSVPSKEYTDGSKGDAGKGGQIFRVNCAMCHNVAAGGGALTEGKFAPELQTVAPEHIYEAMVTGPQNMPVFSDTNLTPQDKADIITSIQWMTQNTSMVGGYNLGSIGPVAEGLFIWIFGLGAATGFAIWITSRPN